MLCGYQLAQFTCWTIFLHQWWINFLSKFKMLNYIEPWFWDDVILPIYFFLDLWPCINIALMKTLESWYFVTIVWKEKVLYKSELMYVSVECWSQQMYGREVLMCSKYHWLSIMICLTIVNCTFTGKLFLISSFSCHTSYSKFNRQWHFFKRKSNILS